MAEPAPSFPRQKARTRGFTLGLPRNVSVAEDGSRVAFLRSRAGDDPVNCLWVFDVEEVRERLVFDPRETGVEEADIPEAERARRERTRERAGGVVAYATDPLLRIAAFPLSGRLFVADLVSGEVKEVSAVGSAFDPRPDPTGQRVAYVSGRTLRVVDEGGRDVLLAGEDDPNLSWGLAEFIASEEMDRFRGHWWSPDGTRIAATRVDERPVRIWHISHPVDPEAPPRAVRFPAAGTDNAIVTVSVLGLDGTRVDVGWDRDSFPYLARVSWQEGHPLTLLVQSRDQRVTQVLAVDDRTGGTRALLEERDPAWVELVDGIPAWLTDGRLVTTVGREDTRCLAFDGEPVTPSGLQVRKVVHAVDDVVFTATEEPTETHLWRLPAAGEPTRLTDKPGIHDGVAGGDVLVVTSSTMDHGPVTVVRRLGRPIATLASQAEHPVIEPQVTLFCAGARDLRSALLLPEDAEPGQKLPVLLDPYGGPQVQRVTRDRGQFLEAQWFADQGFAVLVADGRGTPGRGLAWERAVHLALIDPPLEDQVDALHAAAERYDVLDLDRVAIRGWSFGGYLSVCAVLRRPDVFHAAIAGAPVTDQRLYDTHYTERYLGHPDEQPEAYLRSSLIDDAPNLERPLLLIHGMADDNVVVAHTLRLSRALLQAGRPHTVLPLSGVTHMTPQEVVAENLLLLQLDFLRRALGLDTGGSG